jgi:ORF6N domain
VRYDAVKAHLMADEKTELIISDEILISKIHYIREQKVMLDRDLAELYGVEPRRLREQVKRNAERLPANFMFQLTENEVDTMVSQNATPSRQHLGVRIIEIFVKMREMVSTYKDVLLKLEQLERKVDGHDGDIQVIFDYLKQLINPPQEPRPRIGFRRKDELD